MDSVLMLVLLLVCICVGVVMYFATRKKSENPVSEFLTRMKGGADDPLPRVPPKAFADDA